MKPIKIVSFLLIAIFAMSCNENRVYEKHRKNFVEYRWESTNVPEFSPEITEIDQEYKVYFAFRHLYGFQIASIGIDVEITTPSGVTTNKIYQIDITEEGVLAYKASCGGSYCDLETLIEDNYKFEEVGIYTYKITHLMDQDPMLNVVEVGLIIDKIPVEEK
jgi:gliding motility-associated lipoprotein GldH